MDLALLDHVLADAGEPAFRARQARRAATIELAERWADVTTLPLALRTRLEEQAPLRELEVEETQRSRDGTVKLRLRTRDGYPLEAVSMRHRERHTVCLSSQSGCALACTFCATGAMGFGRNLTSGE